jgi:hypothetical protein
MFTTPCFIRKNTPELREKLDKLGYSPTLNGHGEWFIPMDELPYLETFPMSKSYMGRAGFWSISVIDCGTNEAKFLALAALRDDTDNEQWFTNGVDWAKWRDGKYMSGFEFSYLPSSIDYSNYHKATADDIIEHFTTKGGADDVR